MSDAFFPWEIAEADMLHKGYCVEESGPWLSAFDLMASEFPDLAPVIDGYVYRGLTVLAGRPKGGKSFLCLNLALAVASPWGRLLDVEADHGSVLYLALEDPLRRLQARLGPMLGTHPAPRGLFFATQWPRLGPEGLGLLRTWLDEHTDAKLVVIDTLGRVRPLVRANSFLYQDDYEAIAMVKALADERSIAVIVVHHTRKAPAEHSVDAVSGTAAITGAADTVLVLRRAEGSRTATLNIVGRDVEDHQEALSFDERRNTWSVEGRGGAESASEVRIAVLELVGHLGTAGIGDIAAGLGMAYDAARMQLVRLTASGFLAKTGRGSFSLMNVSENGHGPSRKNRTEDGSP